MTYHTTNERATTEPLDGRNRFHSAIDPARRAALESLLDPVDHPDLWSDKSLEKLLADRLTLLDRYNEADTAPPEFARAAGKVRELLER